VNVAGPQFAGNPARPAPSNPHGPSDDRLLVERLRAGDHSACTELVDRYAGRLHAMLLHLCGGDAEQAAEFTQEAFARAWTNLDQFAGGSSFYTWLYRCARNRAIDLLARKRPHATDLATLQRSAPDVPPGQELERRELAGTVRAALATLDPEHREVLLLREYDGLDYAQIAAALSIAEGTVKSRLNRARLALRERLAGHLDAGDLP
jgi:RNA polymerase sigma-70 factor (ECF subfamily)